MTERAQEELCDAAEETFEQLSGTMQMLTLVYEEAIVSANDYLRAVTEQFYLIPELADDAVNEVEEEQCLRRLVRCHMTETMLGGSVASWDAHEHVSQVISHRDGTYTVFARMFPRLSWWEVKRLHKDLKRFLPSDVKVTLMAVWEKRKKRKPR
jgi:hypothetical protein